MFRKRTKLMPKFPHIASRQDRNETRRNILRRLYRRLGPPRKRNQDLRKVIPVSMDPTTG